MLSFAKRDRFEAGAPDHTGELQHRQLAARPDMLQMRSTFAQNHHAPEAVSLQARHAALQTGPGAGPHRARARDCAGVQGCSVPGGDTLAHAAKYLASGGSYSVGQAGPAGPASKAPVPATQTSSGSSGNSLGQKRPAGPEAKAGPGDLRSAHFCCSRCGRDLSSAGFAQRVLHVKKCAAAAAAVKQAREAPLPAAFLPFVGRAPAACVAAEPAPSAPPRAASVRVWLRSLQLERHADAFEAEQVDMACLPVLTAGDLLALGLADPADRRRALAAAAALRPPGRKALCGRRATWASPLVDAGNGGGEAGGGRGGRACPRAFTACGRSAAAGQARAGAEHGLTASNAKRTCQTGEGQGRLVGGWSEQPALAAAPASVGAPELAPRTAAEEAAQLAAALAASLAPNRAVVAARVLAPTRTPDQAPAAAAGRANAHANAVAPRCAPDQAPADPPAAPPASSAGPKQSLGALGMLMAASRRRAGGVGSAASAQPGEYCRKAERALLPWLSPCINPGSKAGAAGLAAAAGCRAGGASLLAPSALAARGPAAAGCSGRLGGIPGDDMSWKPCSGVEDPRLAPGLTAEPSLWACSRETRPPARAEGLEARVRKRKAAAAAAEADAAAGDAGEKSACEAAARSQAACGSTLQEVRVVALRQELAAAEEVVANLRRMVAEAEAEEAEALAQAL